MKNYLFYKREIEGLKEVAETLRVIEKSAASYLHFLKKKVDALSQYKTHITAMLRRLSHFYWDPHHPLLKEQQNGDNALLVFTGERGIVGGLYHAIVNEAAIRAGSYKTIWVIGTRGRRYLKEEHIQVNESFPSLSFEGIPSTRQIREAGDVLFRSFRDGRLKKIDILYPKFFSFVQQKPSIIQFLPFTLLDSVGSDSQIGVKNKHPRQQERSDSQTGDLTGFHFERNKTPTPQESCDGFPIFEPSKKFLFNVLLQKYINVSFVEIALEAKLSELAARSVTAEHAIKETEQLVNSLTRDFLKTKHLVVSQKQVESFVVHNML